MGEESLAGQMKLLGLVAIAGAAGSLARYGTNLLFEGHMKGFPLSTVTVNLLGCFLFGLVWELSVGRDASSVFLGPAARVAILTGFLGAFTTFSTFAFDCARMVQSGAYGALAVNLVLHNGAGVALFFLGAAAGRRA